MGQGVRGVGHPLIWPSIVLVISDGRGNGCCTVTHCGRKSAKNKSIVNDKVAKETKSEQETNAMPGTRILYTPTNHHRNCCLYPPPPL